MTEPEKAESPGKTAAFRSNGAQQFIGLFGIFGTGNIGNEATLKTTLCHLRKHMPLATPLVICPGPEAVAAMYGVQAVDWNPDTRSGAKPQSTSRLIRRLQKPISLVRNLWLLRRRMSGCDLFIVPGTGVLDDYALSDHVMPRTFLLWCLAARLARVPVIFASVGAGPIKDAQSRRLMKFTARLATDRSYRDDYSKQFLSSLGVDTRKDRVLPDLAFSHALPVGLRHMEAGIPLTVGIGMMSYFGWSGNTGTGEPIYRAYIAQMNLFARRLLDEGFKIRFLVGRASDNRAIDDLIGALPASSARDQLERNPIRNMDDLLTEISRCDIVVATRFHNVVAALMLGRPTLSIGYSEKNDAVMQQCGLGGFCQSIETLDGSRLLEQFNLALTQRAVLRQIVTPKAREYRATLDGYFTELFSRGISPHH